MAIAMAWPSVLHQLLLLILSLALSAESQNSASDQELQTLLRIRQDWGNPPSLVSWAPSNGPHCNWPEIRCAGGSVVGIILPSMDIDREIPPSICLLQNLSEIDLYNNSIPGSFPAYLANCTNLRSLDLSQNYFVGEIPDDIDRFSSLTSLNLSGNNFSGNIPPSIGRLSALKLLSLHSNLFNGSLLPEIGNLSNLESLLLAYTPFQPTTIPPEFGKLQKLKVLWIGESNLMGEIPESLANLTELVDLDLSMNSLTGKIPSDLFKLKKLQNVFLYNNQLSGEIPRTIEALGLIEFDLSANHLNGSLPEDIGKLKNLKRLVIYANRLSGEIPESTGSIPNLIEIRLFNNSLSGKLPKELGFYSKLEKLEVSENELSGELPQNLCRGGVLYSLVVFSNALTGNLPDSLGNCMSLIGVHLYKNNFYGEIPVGLWLAEQLTTLLIRDNSFSGTLPEKLAWNISRIDISNNRFSGEIPPRISESKYLKVFTASDNLISGTIPIGLTELSELQVLQLNGNRISGEIPWEIGSWKSLAILDLSRNNLFGKIPSSIGSLPVLNVLDLSENKLSGEIPRELDSLKSGLLNLSSNQLTGTIPGGLLSPAYDNSFLNNPLLCRYGPCRFEEPRDSRKLPRRLVVIVSILAVFMSSAAVIFTAIVVRDCRRRKSGAIGHETWKMTSFRRLGFTESNIVQGLSESNLIGHGGAGRVHRIAVRSGEVVAVKKIWKSSRNVDRRIEKQFQAEVEILGSIRHSNIVNLLCCISSEDSKLLVYEYMENGSLDCWIHKRNRSKMNGSSDLVFGSTRSQKLDWPTRLGIAVGAAQGLSYMHQCCSPPIVHRDVKSSNILLDSNFKAKIADFGLARILAQDNLPESTSVVTGSLGYIAPEHAYTHRVNEKCDVYSFGVVLLELVTGRQASEGDGYNSLVGWTWYRLQNGDENSVLDCVDDDIKEPVYLEEMSLVLKLGLICTSTLPSSRPSMKDVLQILLKCDAARHLPLGCKKKPSDHDGAPLLQNTSPPTHDISYESSADPTYCGNFTSHV